MKISREGNIVHLEYETLHLGFADGEIRTPIEEIHKEYREQPSVEIFHTGALFRAFYFDPVVDLKIMQNGGLEKDFVSALSLNKRGMQNAIREATQKARFVPYTPRQEFIDQMVWAFEKETEPYDIGRTIGVLDGIPFEVGFHATMYMTFSMMKNRARYGKQYVHRNMEKIAKAANEKFGLPPDTFSKKRYKQ